MRHHFETYQLYMGNKKIGQTLTAMYDFDIHVYAFNKFNELIPLEDDIFFLFINLYTSTILKQNKYLTASSLCFTNKIAYRKSTQKLRNCFQLICRKKLKLIFIRFMRKVLCAKKKYRIAAAEKVFQLSKYARGKPI